MEPKPRILLLDITRLETGWGGAERSRSIYSALQKLGDVELLVVPPPPCPIECRPGENIVQLLDDPRKANRFYWRKRNYLLEEFRIHARVVAAVEQLHRRYRFSAFFGRYQLAVLGGCDQLGPSFTDIDDLPTETVRPRVPLWNSVRRLALNQSIRRMNHVFVAKQADVVVVRHPKVTVLPCISTKPTALPMPFGGDSPRILLVGGLAWPPNREGALWFIRQVLPRIRAKLSHVSLRFIGAKAEEAGGFPGVDAPGFVDDIISEYRNSSICVCPVRTGAGAPVKLAEAVGFGRATVATSYSARGYQGILEPGRDLLVADSEQDFADACLTLLNDSTARDAIAAQGASTARSKLSQAAIDAIIAKTVGPILLRVSNPKNPT